MTGWVVGVQYDIVRVQCDLAAPCPQGGGWLTGDIDLEGVLLYRESGQYVSGWGGWGRGASG